MGKRLIEILVFLAAAGSALGVHSYSDYTLDDSYITYRYAENIAAGNGFVYNLGERELGTTTPLYTLLLALLAWLGVGTGTSGVAIGALAFAGMVVLSRRLALRFGAPPLLANLLALALCICPPLLRNATSGMETSLYSFLCLGVVVLYLDGRMKWFCLVGATCFLTRPDGAIVLAACGIHDLLTRRRTVRQWLGYAGAVAGLALPWFVFSLAYFGILLPNSGFAKLLQVDDWGHFVKLIAREGAWLGVLIPFVLMGLLHCTSQKREGLVVPLFVGLYFGAFSLLGFPACDWYLGPVHAPLLLLAVLGAAWLLAVPGTPRAMLWGVVVVVAAVHAAGWPERIREIRKSQVWMDSHHGEIGRWLARNSPQDACVAVDNIGYIGYFSGRRILDMTGLIQKDVREGIARTGNRRYAIETYRPGWLAIQDRGATPKYTPSAAWLEEHGYEAVFVVPYDPKAAYRVYRRVL